MCNNKELLDRIKVLESLVHRILETPRHEVTSANQYADLTELICNENTEFNINKFDDDMEQLESKLVLLNDERKYKQH